MKFYRPIKDLLIVSGVCFFVLCAIEDFQPGFVSLWFDIRIVLYIFLLTCFLILLEEFAFGTKK